MFRMRGIFAVMILSAIIMLASVSNLLLGLNGLPMETEPKIPSTRASWIVDKGGSGDFQTIQEAVDAASPGDSININAGTFKENVIINTTLTITGAGIGSTIIDGNYNLDVVRVNANYTNITELTIQNSGEVALNAALKLRSFNNHIWNVELRNSKNGLMLDGSSNNTINDCISQNNLDDGYYLNFDSNFNSIIDCEGYQNSAGVHIYISENNDIIRGTFNNNGFSDNSDDHGILLESTSGTNIIGVNCSENDDAGIFFDNSRNNRVIDCRMDGDRYGLCLFNSKYNNIVDSTMDQCGMYITGGYVDSWNSNSFTDVTINELPLGMFLNETSAEIDGDYGQVIIANCSEIVVTKMNLSKCSIGLQAVYSQKVTINELTSKFNLYGTDITDSENVTFNNCTLDENKVLSYINFGSGVYARGASNLEFNDCSISGNALGFEISGFSNHVNILNCNVIGNEFKGIDFKRSYENTVSDCIIKDNGAEGIMLSQHVDLTVVKDCMIMDNKDHGVLVHSNCESNTIFHNRMTNNNADMLQFGGKQAKDQSSSNRWNISGIGNWWSDWFGPDKDGNGIVDEPYELEGVGYAFDRCPLTESYGYPNITNLNDPEATEGVPYEIQYTAFDPNTPLKDLIWSFSSGGDWLIFTDENKLTGTPENDDVGTEWVNISVSDGQLSTFTNFTITVENVNDDPTIITDPQKNCLEGQFYSVHFQAEDIDPTNDNITWGLLSNASFLTINETTGFLNGTPKNPHVGTHHLQIFANDGKGGYGWMEYDLVVIDVNEAPIGSNATIEIFEDSDIQKRIIHSIFTDSDGDELVFDIEPPEHIFVNYTEPFIEFFPSKDFSGTEKIVITASDGLASTTSVLTIVVLPINDPITAVQIYGMEEGASITYPKGINLTSSIDDVDQDYEGDTYTYKWTSDISGNIGETDSLDNVQLPPGTHEITLRVQDLNGTSAETAITVVVKDTEKPVVDDDDDDDDSEPNSSLTYLYIGIAILIILLIVGLVIYYRRMSQEPEKTKDGKLVFKQADEHDLIYAKDKKEKEERAEEDGKGKKKAKKSKKSKKSKKTLSTSASGEEQAMPPEGTEGVPKTGSQQLDAGEDLEGDLEPDMEDPELEAEDPDIVNPDEDRESEENIDTQESNLEEDPEDPTSDLPDDLEDPDDLLGDSPEDLMGNPDDLPL